METRKVGSPGSRSDLPNTDACWMNDLTLAATHNAAAAAILPPVKLKQMNSKTIFNFKKTKQPKSEIFSNNFVW